MPEKLHYRTMTLRVRGDQPSTFDREKRTVDVTLSTEEPVTVWGEDEILLSEGARIPKDKKIPLLDTHNRFTIDGILGSIRNVHKANGEVVGTAKFSELVRGEDALTLVEEGHLTDVSVGYRVNKYVRVAEKETQKIKGKDYKGPVVIVTDWVPKEGSVAPVGADVKAKVRAGEPEKEKEGLNMDKELRQYLESRGLPEDATDEQAYEFLGRIKDEDAKRVADPPVTPTEPSRDDDDLPGDPIDEEKVRTEAELTERTRITEITAMGERLGNADLAAKLVEDGADLDAARERFLDFVTTREEPAIRAAVAVDERDKFRGAALDSILMRSGIDVEDPSPGADDLMGFSLREMARESLRIRGLSTKGTVLEMVGRALTASDFPLILADSARKALFVGYDTAEETWPMWCATGSVADFKTHSSLRASETDDLDEIPEHGEYHYGDMTEAREQYAVVTYGKLFALTRQSIINDDLNALTDIPMKHGEAAARKVGDLPYAVLTANAAMGDGTALFDAGHGNVGTGGVPSETTFGEAIKLAKLQKDIGGKRGLNIRLQYFIGPVALEGAVEIFLTSNMYAGADATAFRNNIYAGSRFTRVYDARLDADSAVKYYFAGAKGKTVTVFFLNGVNRPYMETKQGWTVDGVEYKVRIDAGAKAMDWKAMVYNAGA
jgi:hypothetical protein